MRQLKSVNFYKPAYYPGCPITKNCVDALLTRWLGELSGFLCEGYAHISLDYCYQGNPNIYRAEMTDEGVWSYELPTEPADYQHQFVSIPMSTCRNSFIIVTNRVTLLSLVKKMLRVPLSSSEYICTDLYDLFMGWRPRHLDPEELMAEIICNQAWLLSYKELVKACQPISITPDVRNVVRVTTLQCMFMGMVTALGAGHLIRKGHLKW